MTALARKSYVTKSATGEGIVRKPANQTKDGAPAAIDPLLLIAHEIAKADAATESHERASMEANKRGDGLAESYRKSAVTHEVVRYYGLKNALSFIEATSLDGAAVQLGEAISQVDWLFGLVPEDSPCDERARELKGSLDRLLMSALRAVEKASGNQLHEVGLGCLRHRFTDEWEPVERRLAALKVQLRVDATPDPMLAAVLRKREIEDFVDHRSDGYPAEQTDRMIAEACSLVVGPKATTKEGIVAALKELEMELIKVENYEDDAVVMGLLRGAMAGLAAQ